MSGRQGSALSSVRLPSLGHCSDQNGPGSILKSSNNLLGQNGVGSATNSQLLLSKKKLPLLAAIKPYNQEAERERFFQSNFMYNPQFAYRCQPEPDVLKKYSTPNARYLDQAIHIMNTALKRYGTYEEFERRTGGRLLSKAEIHTFAREYLKKERLEDKVFINLSEDLVSRGSMTRVKGRPTLNVRVDNVREHWMDGLLRHEVGTHYIRSLNNRYQSWNSWKKRQEMELGPVNPTEEGLASLHSVIFRKDPCLWRSALLYYVTFKAAFMSFVDLFEDLGRFVSDPFVKWDYCLRVKRGLTDTGQPGAFCKDQVYLSGALQILKHREFIDFHALTKLGKISFKDIERLRDVGDLENTRVPNFMVNIENYRNKLEKIVKANGLDDYELEKM
ncbi:putative tyrosine carboxypeptidase MATCAP2 [Lineus longissimus]|uniref:putative tyrosine carboxypeptidase MATCAP2 n=1 Tax=Lineus longissimus TaxID=88925 RepID=UPI00315D112A